MAQQISAVDNIIRRLVEIKSDILILSATDQDEVDLFVAGDLLSQALQYVQNYDERINEVVN